MTTALRLAAFALAVVGGAINLTFVFTSDASDRYQLWMLLPVVAALVLLILVIRRRRREQSDDRAQN